MNRLKNCILGLTIVLSSCHNDKPIKNSDKIIGDWSLKESIAMQVINYITIDTIIKSDHSVFQLFFIDQDSLTTFSFTDTTLKIDADSKSLKYYFKTDSTISISIPHDSIDLNIKRIANDTMVLYIDKLIVKTDTSLGTLGDIKLTFIKNNYH